MNIGYVIGVVVGGILMISIGAFLLNVSQSSGELSVYETSRIDNNTALEYLKDDLRMTGYRISDTDEHFSGISPDSSRVEIRYCPDDADDCDTPSQQRRVRWEIVEGDEEEGMQTYQLVRRIIGPDGDEQRRITVSNNLSENSRFTYYDGQGNPLGTEPADAEQISQIGLFIETFPREQYGDGAIRTRVETTIVPPNLNL